MTEDQVRGAFRTQGKACAMLGSAFMGQLMPLLGERLTRETAVGAHALDWPGDPGPGGQSVPLRLAGALHALVIEGVAPTLSAVYPPAQVSDDALWQAIEHALHQHEARLLEWMTHAPQTNEVRRSAVLLPALWWCLQRHPLPLCLSELGASAGLNLCLDGFDLTGPWGVAGPGDSAVRLSPDWRGTPPAPQPLQVVDRAGVDLNPLDTSRPENAVRALAYLWPDQPDRAALTRGAMAMMQPASVPDKGDAAAWLERRLTQPRPGQLHVVYTTIAWQYFPPETQAACRAALARCGAQATPDSPLAHLSFEADGQPDSAAITLTLWSGDSAPSEHALGRADFHGRWVAWSDPA